MFIKQLSVFVENKSGRLAEITALIAAAGVDLRAVSIADTVDFGILRLIVDQPGPGGSGAAGCWFHGFAHPGNCGECRG